MSMAFNRSLISLTLHNGAESHRAKRRLPKCVEQRSHVYNNEPSFPPRLFDKISKLYNVVASST